MKAFSLSDDLQLKYHFPGFSTLLCLCSTTHGVCAGSDDGCFYVFSPQLALLTVVAVHPEEVWGSQLNCCLPAFETVLLGSECGILYRLPDSASISSTQIETVKVFWFCSIFCLQFNADNTLLYAGLENGVDALCVSTFTSFFFIPWTEAVWSISAWPGEDVIVIGTTCNGIVVVPLHTENIRRSRHDGDSNYTFWTMPLRVAEMGTCSAISHVSKGSWYAASNRSRIYFCGADGTITSRVVALPVVEPGDHSQTPRRDIYDVLCITNNLSGHLLPVDA